MSAALGGHLTLPRGAVIRCPNPHCNDKIGCTTRDLKPGDRLTSDLLDESGQGIRVDKKVQCKKCNFRWVINLNDLMRISTGRGWFPPERQIIDSYNEVR